MLSPRFFFFSVFFRSQKTVVGLFTRRPSIYLYAFLPVFLPTRTRPLLSGLHTLTCDCKAITTRKTKHVTLWFTHPYLRLQGNYNPKENRRKTKPSYTDLSNVTCDCKAITTRKKIAEKQKILSGKPESIL